MYAGRAVESGPARAVLSTPAHPYTRCLQLANPSLRAERRALYVMPDQMPSLRQLQTPVRLPFRAALSARRLRIAAAPSRRTLRSPPADQRSPASAPQATRTIGTTAGDGVAADAPGRPLLQVEELAEAL